MSDSDTNRERFWFILGPSGTGKSYMGSFSSSRLSWFHYEIDQFPHDGITHFGLREEWDDFLDRGVAGPLLEELTRRSCSLDCRGAVLTFPGNLILPADKISLLANHVKLVYLYGRPEFCKRAFLCRERKTGRNLPGHHWEKYNASLFPLLGDPSFEPFRLVVFQDDGSHRSARDIFDEVESRV